MAKEDRRIQKTKAAISAALITLLKKKEFTQITINDIAEEANINRGTIYFHYEDKYDLLNKVMEQKLKELKTVCSPITSSTNVVEMASYLTSVYEFFDANYEFFVLMLNNGATGHFHERFKTFVMEEFSKIPISDNKGMHADFSLQFRVNALVGVVEWWIREDHTHSVDEMAGDTLELFLRNR